ncbi:unnamed protein product [Clonostachys byssicola]|uniref:Acyl-coenzyme A thioesterase 8 n=1 Tax=Clonostachys byssicola TaxID=160290 RepID=A0A9N9Y3N3_9HYPO|nr:unnamed protein product [Clonostachys byssicola]
MAARKAPIESIITVEPVPEDGPEVFQSVSGLHDQKNARSVFGGILISHAIGAANQTVPPEYVVCSSKSSFIRPAAGEETIKYAVERTADTRGYHPPRARIPGAREAASSKKSSATRNILTYGLPPPDLGGIKPDDIARASLPQIIHWSTKQDFPVHDRNYLKFREPCDWRPREFTALTSLRNSGYSPGMHMAAIGYISDSYIIGPSLYANMSKVGRMIENVAMAVSLNHSVVFHDFDAKADQWMVCERKSSWGGDGRVLTHQRIWNVETGGLVISCTQEGIARIKDGSFKL